mmetsp:Transcript_9792/g.15063  ORF Transcript_9792/g.15063 Transcript_9792/m.15063 type:complete len:145 (-) Transcript_9792:97-531(-)
MFFCNFCRDNRPEERKSSIFEVLEEHEASSDVIQSEPEELVLTAPVTTPTKKVTYKNVVFEEPSTPCDISQIFDEASDDMNKLFEDAESARLDKENEWRKKRDLKKMNSKKKKSRRNNQTPQKTKKNLAQQHLQKQRSPLSNRN